MLRVTIDLIPKGDTKRRRTLHIIDIANDGSGTAGCGNYTAALSRRGSRKIWRVVRVIGFPRRWRTAYDLLYQVMAAVCAERAPLHTSAQSFQPQDVQ